MKNFMLFVFMLSVATSGIAQLKTNVNVAANGKVGIKVTSGDGRIIPSRNDTVKTDPDAKGYSFEISSRNNDSYVLRLVTGKGTGFSDSDTIQVAARSTRAFSLDASGKSSLHPDKTLGFPITVYLYKSSQLSSEVKKVTIALTKAQQSGGQPEPTDSKDASSDKFVKVKATGIPYYDALNLANHDILSLDAVIEILQLYKNKNPNRDTSAIISDYEDNPFLWQSVGTFLGENQGSKQGLLPTSFLPSAGSSLGGLDVTGLADGMAKFLVARAKQELAASFFDRFKEAISDSEYRDLQTIFPATYNTLTAIGDQIYNYNQYIQTLRASFGKDLGHLTENLPSVIDNHRHFFDRHPDLEATIRSGCYFGGALRDGVHPGDMIANYPVDYLENLQNWKGAIETVQLISASLRDTAQVTDSTSYWVNPTQIRKLVSDSTTLKIYLGLLYEQARHFNGDSIRFIPTSLCAILDSVAVHFPLNYRSYREYITNLGVETNRLDKMVQNYDYNQENDSAAVEEFSGFADASIDWLEAASDIGKLVPTSSVATGTGANIKSLFGHLKDTLAVYFSVARSGVAIASDIKKRSYGAALINIVNIYDLTVAKYSSQSEVWPDGDRAKTADAEKSWLDSFTTASDTLFHRLDVNAFKQIGIDSVHLSALKQTLKTSHGTGELDLSIDKIRKRIGDQKKIQMSLDDLLAQLTYFKEQIDSLENIKQEGDAGKTDNLSGEQKTDSTKFRNLSTGFVTRNATNLFEAFGIDLDSLKSVIESIYDNCSTDALASLVLQTREKAKSLMPAEDMVVTSLYDMSKVLYPIGDSISLRAMALKADEVKVKDGGELKTAGSVMSQIVKYGSFMAAIAQARSSDDVEGAIEAIAMPPGSSRIKRESIRDVALNAYLGLFVGNEYIYRVANSSATSYGVTGPIGIAMSWGHAFLLCRTDDAWSTSIFVSLVDIGSIASFRSQNDSISQIPVVHLRDIFSPGIFLSIGIPGCPISITGGAQIGPNLRSVSSTVNTVSGGMYYRYSFSVNVDIPLLDLYTKPRN